MRSQKKRLIGILLLSLVSLLIPLANNAEAIDTSVTTCPGNGCVDINVNASATVGIQITGTWTGTLTFQVSVGNSSTSSTFTSQLVLPTNSATAVTTTTANGNWTAAIAGQSILRVVVTSTGSGTANVIFKPTQLAFKSGGGSLGGGTVTSVGLSAPTAVFDVSGSPVTTTGTLALTFDTQTANTIFSGPTTGSAAAPTFRSLVAADIPTIVTGTDTDVCFSDGGNLACNDNDFQWNKTTNLLEILGQFDDQLYSTHTVNNIKNQSLFYSEITPGTGLTTAQLIGVNSYQSIYGANNYGNVTGLFGTAVDQNTGTTNSFYGGDFHSRNNDIGTITNAVGSNGEIQNNSTGTITTAAGQTALVGNYDMGTITAGAGFWAYAPFNTGGGSFPFYAAFYADEITDSNITNKYYSWFDSRGVLRVREDALDGAMNNQAIMALYNPRFTKYTPGATNYERCIPACQWETNRGRIGIEVGGTGTLRAIELFGANLSFTSTLTPTVTDTTANSCGTGTQTIAGNDNAGKVTVIGSAGTSCTVTFATAFSNAPSCTVTNETTANLARATSTTTTVVLAGVFAQNDVLAYVCIGR